VRGLTAEDPKHPECCDGLRCGFVAGRGKVCTTCALFGQSCDLKGVNGCCDGEGDCGIAPGSTDGVARCTFGIDKCYGTNVVCNLGAGLKCCGDPDPITGETPFKDCPSCGSCGCDGT
jgi:hypothetical protein